MSKSKPKIAVVSAILGGIDDPPMHADQTLEHDYYLFTDKSFPPRFNSMTPRLQAKIPKCFGWQMAPGYDYYLWVDGSLTLDSPDSLKYFYDNCQDSDVVVLKHPSRTSIYWEYRYNWRGLFANATSNYLTGRYANEFIDEQMKQIKADKAYKDDLLINGGIFMYRNTPPVQAMLKEWWYHISRFLIMDQCSWPYVLKKSEVRFNVLPDDYHDSPYIKHRRHRLHA